MQILQKNYEKGEKILKSGFLLRPKLQEQSWHHYKSNPI